MVGDNTKAIKLLNYVKNNEIEFDTLKYESIAVSVFKNSKDYKNALSTYESFTQKADSIYNIRFDQKSKSIEEKHQLELQAQNDARYKARIIWGCVGGIIFLLMIIIILSLFFRAGKAKKNLAIKKAKISELENRQLKSANELAINKEQITKLENDKLKSEREKLELENSNLQLERDKRTLEAENLAHRVKALEDESESLKAIIADNKKEKLPPEVQNEIKVRIEMLNALLASYITNNDQFEKPYDVWIKELTANTSEFMNSNRLAFQVSHPRFIQYFEEHGLSIDEINYVCLYAIGLRGKDVGDYMKKRSHVNTSSAIRKKLGLDKHETNIRIYVNKLLQSL